MTVSTSLQQAQPAQAVFTTRGRGKIYNNITETVGDTPLVRLNRLPLMSGCVAHVYAKLEFFNPLGSVKDRMALGMIAMAEAEGKIDANTVLVEPTSGNTGIALAFIAAARGYRLILTMPENMSIERRKMLGHLGAELVLTPADQGMRGAIEKAEEIVVSTPGALMLQQFTNPTNPMVHANSTAEEIWHDTNGRVDVFVAGVGTGGTIQGVGEVLKRRKSGVRIVGVEPASCAILSGEKECLPHKIQGIGAGFVPEVLDPKILDETFPITDERAIETARALARYEGIPGGISSGATVAAALEIAARPEMKDKTIVALVASFAERYLSTELFELY